MYTIHKNLTHEQWLEQRSQGIGSSEAGTVLGVNPFDSPYMLWKRKTGRETTPRDENFAMKAGHYLEPAVAQFFEDETGCRVIKSSAGDWLAVDNDRPYLRVSPDRTYWLAGKPRSARNKGIVECKTTQRTIYADDIPNQWYCQLQYQLGVMGLQQGALAWLTAGRNFGYMVYDFNPEFYTFLVDQITEFWTVNVQKDVEPRLSRVDDVIDKYRHQTDGKVVTATADMVSTWAELKVIKAQMSDLQTRQKELEDALKVYLMDGELLCNEEGDTLATWKQAKDSIKFDEKRFALEHPEEYEEYKKTVEGSRRFIVK